jgi:N-methylhydantoinase B/oxoprolinase/acetone carboxylase alpha subunit
LLNGTAIPAKTRVELKANDLVSLETPGGGGWSPNNG